MKRSTWVFFLLFLCAIGIYFLINSLPKESIIESTPIPDISNYLLSEKDTSIVSIHIFASTQYINMDRNNEAIWEITKPTPSPADQTKMSEVETQLSALKILKNLGRTSSLDDFGLSTPKAWIFIKYSSGLERILFIGNLSPTNSGYYVKLDDSDIFIISQPSLDTILQLTGNPPFSADAILTPTPFDPTRTSTDGLSMSPSITVYPTP